MNQYTITPEVDAIREFLEIAGDFTDPLEVVREAVSNSIDAGATEISVLFSSIRRVGRRVLEVQIQDNGQGMDAAGLKSFFDLGNSAKRGNPKLIGEKGHGTKVFFNCHSLALKTTSGGKTLAAIMTEPFAKLHGGELPTAQVEQLDEAPNHDGTQITIQEFNNNDGEVFTHERLKDYIGWFTKFGSIEKLFHHHDHSGKKLVLKGLDRDDPETLTFGHFFPEDSKPIKSLFEEHLVRAPDYYCKKIVRQGVLRKHPDIKYDAIFSIEGNRVKQGYNPMLRRNGYTAPNGGYTVQDRYGLWLCKDHIPIERKNEWVSIKGSEFTKLHAFFNCQELSLTANRGSVANTPAAILEDIQETSRAIYDEVISGDDWREMDWLESEASAYNTLQKEQRDFTWRKGRANASNIAILEKITLIEPTRESGVYALLLQVSTLRPSLLPFEVVDYETHSGIDIIGKAKGNTPVADSALYYIELKFFLDSSMNHCFANMKAIVCWDTELKHGQRITDLSGEERELYVVPPSNDGEYTGYCLRRDRKTEIEVIVLKDYLREMLQLEFRPRNQVTLAT